MLWTSSAPVAYDYLLAALTDAGLNVIDGPSVSGSNLTEAVVFGHADHPAIEHDFAFRTVAPVPTRDQFTIHATVLVAETAGNVRTARLRVYAVLAVIADVIGADITLGGTVQTAMVRTAGLSVQPSAQSAITAVFDLMIECSAQARYST